MKLNEIIDALRVINETFGTGQTLGIADDQALSSTRSLLIHKLKDAVEAPEINDCSIPAWKRDLFTSPIPPIDYDTERQPAPDAEAVDYKKHIESVTPPQRFA